MSLRRTARAFWRQAPRLLGVDSRASRTLLTAAPWFVASLARYKSEADEDFPIELDLLRPYLSDRRAEAGGVDKHYFYQDLWAARRIHDERPSQHVDVGSRIDGFVAHLLTFMPVTVVDVRPFEAPVEGLSFVNADATEMAGFADESLESLSCLHALEHFGLGRYGDPVAPDAWRRALGAFSRVLAPGGRLYLSVPVGRQRVEFNAHRIFAPQTILEALSELSLLEFSVVDDAGRFIARAEPSGYDAAHFACGLFALEKPRSRDFKGAGG